MRQFKDYCRENPFFLSRYTLGISSVQESSSLLILITVLAVLKQQWETDGVRGHGTEDMECEYAKNSQCSSGGSKAQDSFMSL